MDLTEAGDIKKRWQEFTEELYRKYLNDPDNHDGVCFIHSSVCMSVPVSQFIPLSPCLVIHTFVLYVCLSHTHILPFKHFP